jgi:NADH-quinone oxidoreductase subunit L
VLLIVAGSAHSRRCWPRIACVWTTSSVCWRIDRLAARLHDDRHRRRRGISRFLHLLTHGLFKALLFLGAGAVIHAVGSNDLPNMGGLA